MEQSRSVMNKTLHKVEGCYKTIHSWVFKFDVTCFWVEHLGLHHIVRGWMSGGRQSQHGSICLIWVITFQLASNWMFLCDVKASKCISGEYYSKLIHKICIFPYKKCKKPYLQLVCSLALTKIWHSNTHTHTLFKALPFWYSTYQLFLPITALRYSLRALWMMTTNAQSCQNTVQMFTDKCPHTHTDT